MVHINSGLIAPWRGISRIRYPGTMTSSRYVGYDAGSLELLIFVRFPQVFKRIDA